MNMHRPLVTIGIPTYNRADDFLKGTLESALAQTYKNIEIIVSDNHSTDNTEQLVKGYQDKRVRYFRQKENLGPFKNMNFCIEKAKGVYFLMLHDDDLIDPRFVETCLDSIDYKEDKGIIIAGSREIDVEGNIKVERENHCQGLSTYDFLLTFYQKKVHLFLCSILFNTEKLKRIGGLKEYYRYYTDAAAEFEMIGKTERVDVPDILGSFRSHGDSFSKKPKISQWCTDSLKLLDLACSLVETSEEKRELRRVGMQVSAERLYRYATLWTDNHYDRAYAYFSVFKSFNYNHLPQKKHLYKWMPWLRYILSPRSVFILKHKAE